MTSIHSARYAGLLTTDSARISSQSLQLDAKDSRIVRGRHLLVYGATFKHSHFDLSFVPDVNRREEAGAFVTDDVHLNDRVRLTAGARLDWFDTFGLFASPRLGVRFEPSKSRTFRATYNRAYVAPSTVESFANFPSSIEIPLGVATFPVPITTLGSRDLRPQTTDAFELGYNGVVGSGVTVSASLYHQRSKGVINLMTAALYSASDPRPDGRSLRRSSTDCRCRNSSNGAASATCRSRASKQVWTGPSRVDFWLRELLVSVPSRRDRRERWRAAACQHPATPSRESLGIRRTPDVRGLPDRQLYGQRVLDRRPGDPGLDRSLLARERDRRGQLRTAIVLAGASKARTWRTARCSITSSEISSGGAS